MRATFIKHLASLANLAFLAFAAAIAASLFALESKGLWPPVSLQSIWVDT
jgi:hypothetical protein